jgi:outer membrane protein TolC
VASRCLHSTRRVRATGVTLLAALLTTTSAGAQEPDPPPLTLDAAIARALTANSDVAAAEAAEAETRHRRAAARADWFPRVDLQEGWQRGDAPVFVFSSLLGQRRFTEANFAVDTLTHPEPLDNHRAAALVSQRIFDGGRTSAAARAADAHVAVAQAQRRQTAADTALAVTDAYAQALTADARVRAASAAIETATEDLGRATARRDVGTATDADVLAMTVHLAQMRAREITARSDAQIARATLNRLMGEPLDAPFAVVEPMTPVPAARTPSEAEAAALAARPDVHQAARRVDLARAQQETARASRLPTVGFEGGYEWQGGNWSDRAGSWVVGIRAGLSLSSGGAEAANARAARSALERAELERSAVESAARLDVRSAVARLEAARARQDVATAVVAQAREGQRIVRDRFTAGLTTTTDVLRAAEALLDAESLAVSTRVEVTMATAVLDRALGRVPGGLP